METKEITLTKENIDTEHICCPFSDKKCAEGYEIKKVSLRALDQREQYDTDKVYH